MRKRVRTLLGDLTVFTDQRDWGKLVEMLVEVAKELDVPLPRALYYGPPDYTKLLSPMDFKDRHLTYRGITSTMEYWHRDHMILFFERLGDQPLDRVRALLAHELVHHSDNIDGLNITSYALPCSYFCNEGLGSICVTYFKVCLDAFRNVSVNSRLPSGYWQVYIADILEQAREAMKDAEDMRDDTQRRLALLYSVILTSSLTPFIDTGHEAKEILETALRGSPLFEELSLFIERLAEEIFGRKPSIAIEESYINSLKPLLCSSMKQISQQ